MSKKYLREVGFKELISDLEKIISQLNHFPELPDDFKEAMPEHKAYGNAVNPAIDTLIKLHKQMMEDSKNG